MGTSKFIFVLCFLGCQVAFSGEPTESIRDPFLISQSVQKPTYVFQSLTLSDANLLECDLAREPEVIKNWKNWVRSKLRSTTILDLIDMQMKLFGRFGDLRIFNLIRDGSLGSLRPISCLEKNLFARHLRIQKDLAPHTATAGYGVEFIAYILARPEKPEELKIHFLSVFKNMVNDSEPIEIAENMNRDLADGYEYKTLLHNHPFFFGQPDIAGTVIPSGSRGDSGDISFFLLEQEQRQLQEAVITNGFDSLSIPSADFTKFPPLIPAGLAHLQSTSGESTKRCIRQSIGLGEVFLPNFLFSEAVLISLKRSDFPQANRNDLNVKAEELCLSGFGVLSLDPLESKSKALDFLKTYFQFTDGNIQEMEFSIENFGAP